MEKSFYLGRMLKRYAFLSLLFGLLLCTCAPSPENDAVKEGRNQLPNILFILTDDQGIGDLSLHGNDSIRTPNMDALLTSGARFNRFYVSPVCAPPLASFLSGLYAPRTGAVFVTRRRETMDDDIVTIPEYLKHAGYRTGLFGKWHNGATKPYDPAGQGFDQFLGFTLGHFNDYFNGELENERNELVPFSGDLTQILTDTASAFMLEEHRDPFFCMLTYQAPHTPVQVADKYWDAVKSRGLTDYNTGIYAMVESVDDRIGQLLGRLEKSDKLNNTIVIFSTDNGPNGDRYRMGLKGMKGQVDEGGVRVPFGIRFPGEHPANGQSFGVPAAHIDLVPTLLDIVGLPVPEHLDGRSLMPVLEPDSAVTFDQNRMIYAFKQGYDFSPWPGSMRDENYLYVFRAPGQHELYAIQKDPEQQTNIMATKQDGSAGLRKRGLNMARIYAEFAASVARPDLVAPPINLDAAHGSVRLLAHAGDPLGTTHFMDEYGWANDFFVDLGPDGAEWPVYTEEGGTYSVNIRYHLADEEARELVLRTDKGDRLTIELPPARTSRIPVADRVPRKEVYPRKWGEVQIKGLRVMAGSERIIVSSPSTSTGLWLKELLLLNKQ